MIRVFVSGCFDRLHPGHIEFLRFARSFGDHLTVSVGNDETIRQLKKREPIFNQFERVGMVNALKLVDFAFIPSYVGALDCWEGVQKFKPDIWVVNSDDGNLTDKRKIAVEFDIKLIYNPRPEGYHSTTQLIQKMGEH